MRYACARRLHKSGMVTGPWTSRKPNVLTGGSQAPGRLPRSWTRVPEDPGSGSRWGRARPRRPPLRLVGARRRPGDSEEPGRAPAGRERRPRGTLPGGAARPLRPRDAACPHREAPGRPRRAARGARARAGRRAPHLELARADVEEAERRLADRLRELYVLGEVDPLAVILAAESLSEALSAFDGLTRLADQDRTLLEQLRSARLECSGRSAHSANGAPSCARSSPARRPSRLRWRPRAPSASRTSPLAEQR